MPDQEQKQNIDTRRLDEQLESTYKEIEQTWEVKEATEVTLRQSINRAALILKEKFTMLGLEGEFNTISRTICDRFKYKGELQIYVAHTLPAEFKRKYTQQEILSANRYLIEECSMLADQLKQNIDIIKSVYPEDIGRDGFIDIAQALYDNKNRFEKLAAQYKIPLPYESDKLPEDRKPKVKLHPDDIPDEEKIRIAESTSIDQWKNHGKHTFSIVNSLFHYHYISRNFGTEQNNIFRVEALNMLFRPLVDRKWQRDWGEWCTIIENYYDQGGTYASSKSAVDSTLVDEKTGKPIRRKITKEQIDAKHVPYLNDMRYMVSTLMPDSQVFKGTSAGKDNLDKTAFFKREDGIIYIEVEKHEFTKEQLESLHEPIIKGMRELISKNPVVEGLFIRFRENERAWRSTRSIELHDVLSEAA